MRKVKTTLSPIILDGPTGTELIRRGFRAHPILWTAPAVVLEPVLVKSVHANYVRAGAQVITAHTSRTSFYTMQKVGFNESEARQWTQAAVTIAQVAASHGARKARRILIAGSMFPLEDCYQPSLVPNSRILAREHARMASWLKEARCSILLGETLGSTREAVAVAQAGTEAGFRKVWISFITDGSGHKLLGGEDLLTAARKCIQAGATAILVNCVHADVATRALMALQPLARNGVVIGAYPNAQHMHVRHKRAGKQPGNIVSWEKPSVSANVQAKQYAKIATHWVHDLNTKIVGTCCGTDARYIRKVVIYFRPHTRLLSPTQLQLRGRK